MPYRKTRRTRRYRKRRQPSRGKIYGRAAGQLWKDVQKLKNFVNVEFKEFNTTTNTSASLTPTLQTINNITQGDTNESRDGNQVRIKSLQTDLYLNQNTGGNALVRCLWIIDIDGEAGATFADMFNRPITNSITILRNLDNKRRFVVLKDKTFYLQNGTNQQIHYNMYRRMDMKPTWSDAAAITSNRLYFVFFSNNGVTAPFIEATHRLRYIDN